MKHLLTAIRWIVGLLFIFSGLVKANDPLGLSYKMQEFFEAWEWSIKLNEYTLGLSIAMNAFEIIAGVALLIGWRMRILSWSLLALTVFFTFLTGYASLATNPDGGLKFKSCGCFGDCLPLDPTQSFLKDILLLILILILLLYRNKIQQTFSSKTKNLIILLFAVFLSIGFQWYSLTYLPLVDCLPFKKGNDLLVLRQKPPNAIPDSFDLRFIYSKDGVEKEFKVSELPDSTWTFKDRKQVLIRKGKNNEPLIKDFIMKNKAGDDLTEVVLGQKGIHYLLFIQSAEKITKHDQWLDALQRLLSQSAKVSILSALPNDVEKILNEKGIKGNFNLFIGDATSIKTAARAVPVLYRMNGSVVEAKWSGASASSWK